MNGIPFAKEDIEVTFSIKNGTDKGLDFGVEHPSRPSTRAKEADNAAQWCHVCYLTRFCRNKDYLVGNYMITTTANYKVASRPIFVTSVCVTTIFAESLCWVSLSPRYGRNSGCIENRLLTARHEHPSPLNDLLLPAEQVWISLLGLSTFQVYTELVTVIPTKSTSRLKSPHIFSKTRQTFAWLLIESDRIFCF